MIFLILWKQILCLQGSPDGPEQYVVYDCLHDLFVFLLACALKGFLLFRYVAIMNAIFSAQRSMVLNVAFRFFWFLCFLYLYICLIIPVPLCLCCRVKFIWKIEVITSYHIFIELHITRSILQINVLQCLCFLQSNHPSRI